MFFFNQLQCNEVSILVDETNDPNCIYHEDCKAKLSKSFKTLDETLTYMLVEYGPHLVKQFGYKVKQISATFEETD